MAKRVTLGLLFGAALAAAYLAGRLAGEGDALDIGMCMTIMVVCSAIVARSVLAGSDPLGCAARSSHSLQQIAGV